MGYSTFIKEFSMDDVKLWREESEREREGRTLFAQRKIQDPDYIR